VYVVGTNAEGVETSSPALRALARYAGDASQEMSQPLRGCGKCFVFPRLARWRAQAWAEGLNAFGVMNLAKYVIHLTAYS
jgi:hypothetical protein